MRIVLMAGLLFVFCVTGLMAQQKVSSFIQQEPPYKSEAVWVNWTKNTALRQVGQWLNVPRVTRKLLWTDHPTVDFVEDEVPDSSFFTNREIPSMSHEALRWGPTAKGDFPQPPFMIVKNKTQGVTPGFFVEDARQIRYLFKFDHPDYPELGTGAEAVTSKLVHALGYNVPSYEVCVFTRDQLVAGTLITDDALDRLLEPYLSEQGEIRVSASRFVDRGEIKGYFSFEHYKQWGQLRALHVVYAWCNNTDAKDLQTLMTWDGQTAWGYLIDFGSSLGADAKLGVKDKRAGWENVWDTRARFEDLLTLGLWPKPYKKKLEVFSPAVGTFNSHFKPRRWEPQYPNMAFEDIGKREAQWIAGRISLFTDDKIRAAVEAGAYSDPKDRDRIVEILGERRDKIVETYLEK